MTGTFHDEPDVRYALEYAGEIKEDRDRRIYINRIYQNAIIFRMTYTMNHKMAFELRHFHAIQNRGTRTRAEVEYKWSDHLSTKGGLEMFTGPDDTFFGAYKDNDRFFIKVKYSF